MRTIAILTVLLSAPLWAQVSDEEWYQAQLDLKGYLESEYPYGVSSAFEVVGRDNSKRAVKLIVKLFDEFAEDPAVFEVVRDAVAGLTDSKALKEVYKEVSKAKDPRTRIVLAEGLARRGEDEDFEALFEALDKEKKLNVAVAIVRILGGSSRRDAIDTLVAKMKSLDVDQGPVWEACGHSLGRLTGQDLTFGADFESWLIAQGDDFQLADPDAFMPRQESDAGGTVTFFGTSITLDHLVFIIDISGSMMSTDPYPPGYSGGGSTTGDEEESDDGLEIDDERRRIYRAKKELIGVLDRLDPAIKFNIVAYSSSAKLWRNEDGERSLHKASSANIKDAKDWVAGLEADGVTVTDEALQLGLSIEGVQGVYLLSDGFATADGTRKIPTPTILDIVREGNRYNQAKIYTFGFEGADEELMLALARETGGTYRFIEW